MTCQPATCSTSKGGCRCLSHATGSTLFDLQSSCAFDQQGCVLAGASGMLSQGCHVICRANQLFVVHVNLPALSATASHLCTVCTLWAMSRACIVISRDGQSFTGCKWALQQRVTLIKRSELLKPAMPANWFAMAHTLFYGVQRCCAVLRACSGPCLNTLRRNLEPLTPCEWRQCDAAGRKRATLLWICGGLRSSPRTERGSFRHASAGEVASSRAEAPTRQMVEGLCRRDHTGGCWRRLQRSGNTSGRVQVGRHSPQARHGAAARCCCGAGLWSWYLISC